MFQHWAEQLKGTVFSVVSDNLGAHSMGGICSELFQFIRLSILSR